MNGFANNNDPFSKFWAEMASKMAGTATNPFAGQPQQTQDAAMKAMRQAFMEAWAQQCEEFLGSEAFLEQMKKSMDSAMTFKEQVNQFVNQAAESGPLSTRSDAESITQALASFEDRVIDQLTSLTNRMDELERQVASGSKGKK